MLAQIPEEKRDLIKPLFQKKQPNNSALWCYFDGKMTGKTFVDDITSPTKAICRLDMSWTYVSDDADLPWIEEVLGEVIKKGLASGNLGARAKGYISSKRVFENYSVL
ncbi:MAG: hypothetical protein MST05_13645 [Treponema sp.]|nr:hypothetical protein [Treponema sp.]